MRRVLVLVCALLLVSTALTAQFRRNTPPERIDDARIGRLMRWLELIEQHQPGVADSPFVEVRSWSREQVEDLRDDVLALVALIDNPGESSFATKRGNGPSVDLGYTTTQTGRLRALACTAGGMLTDPHCLFFRVSELDEPLQQLASHATDARKRGDRNYAIRRGVLLHTDVLVLSDIGFGMMMLELSDGTVAGVSAYRPHAEIATDLVNHVTPPGARRPAPGQDAMVHDWYVATSEWMEGNEQHSDVHLDRARELFPRDPDILFLSGCLHESLASPAIQEPIRSFRNRPGVSFAVESEPRELRRAEELFGEALAVQPTMYAARVRLAHVLLEQQRFADALRVLADAPAEADTARHRYYAALFAGASDEGLGRYDAAREAYTFAAQLYPAAQSPYVALSELAARRGLDPLPPLDRMFAVAIESRDDPWWVYSKADVEDPDAQMERFWRHFRGGPPS